MWKVIRLLVGVGFWLAVSIGLGPAWSAVILLAYIAMAVVILVSRSENASELSSRLSFALVQNPDQEWSNVLRIRGSVSVNQFDKALSELTAMRRQQEKLAENVNRISEMMALLVALQQPENPSPADNDPQGDDASEKRFEKWRTYSDWKVFMNGWKSRICNHQGVPEQ